MRQEWLSNGLTISEKNGYDDESQATTRNETQLLLAEWEEEGRIKNGPSSWFVACP